MTGAWEQRYSGGGNRADDAMAVVVDGHGNVVVTGFSDNGLSTDYYTIKYAYEDGRLLWGRRYDGPGTSEDKPQAMAVDADDNVFVTGFSRVGPPSRYYADFYTAKYAASDGALLWERRYDGPVGKDDFANAMVVDGNGNVIVTGSSWTETSRAYYTAKYAAANGAILWENLYDGGSSHYNEPRSIAVDGNGDVIVTGRSHSGVNVDYYTAKYASSDGTLLWERRLSRGLDHLEEPGPAVAVDADGNVAITGSAFNGTNFDYYTAKYAAADGGLLWEQTRNGSANIDDYGTAVAMDGNGNVVVTGALNGAQNGYRYATADYYTAKYAATDGTLLWEQTYATNGDDGDYAKAVGVDVFGDVIVSGNSDGLLYTAKYAGKDGQLLWERHRGGDIAMRGLALGPGGIVAVTGFTFHERNGPQTDDYVTIAYREGLDIRHTPAGVRMQFSGIPGQSYQIERAPTITGSWSTQATLTAPGNGILEYEDIIGLAGSFFYRTSTP